MSSTAPAEHFATRQQQREAATLGMWIFLAGETLLFGGLFTGYTVYRVAYPEAFAATSGHLYLWIGAANTVILLLSSLMIALAVHAALAERKRPCLRFLGATIVLGVLFLALKGVEYYLDYEEGMLPPLRFEQSKLDTDPGLARLFLSMYFIMTALHALHMLGGLTVMAGLVVLVQKHGLASWEHVIENTGLYWHFVDIVWIFLFPLFYLIGAT